MELQSKESVIGDVFDAIDNAIAHRRILDQVLRSRDEIGVPKGAYEFVRSRRSRVDGLAKVELVYSLPVTKKVQFGTAIIGGDLELTINVWAMPLCSKNRGITFVKSNKRLVDDVEKCEVHVVVPLTEDQAGVIW